MSDFPNHYVVAVSNVFKEYIRVGNRDLWLDVYNTSTWVSILL